MAVTDLPSVPVDGNVSTIWVPVIADPAAPKVSELTASGVVDLSCYLVTNPTVGGDQATIADPRACSLQDLEQPGKVTYSMSLNYIRNPLVPAKNKAYTTLAPMTGGFVVQRFGMLFSIAYAAAQIVDVWSVTCGLQVPQSESGSVLKSNQKMFVTGFTQLDVAVAA